MVKAPILLLGRDGQVAWELRRTLACLGSVAVVGRNSAEGLDLARPETLRPLIDRIQPSLIVNAAAYTAVDMAEQEPERAFRVNAEAVGVLAECARNRGIGLVHYSTDYVFPGDGQQPYMEEDTTGPLGQYGQSKAAGEEAIRAAGAAHLIFRTAWVYGRRGQNFLLTMLRLMREREQLGIVGDQWGAPTWSRMIAEATALALAQCRHNGAFDLRESSGTYHMTSAGQTSWHGFATAIREIGIELNLLPPTAAQLNAITTDAYPTPARRPAYSVLSNGKLADRFGVQLPPWRTALEACLSETLLP